MSQKYVIQWVSKVNGRAGRGTKVFDRGEAEALVKELNDEFPEIHHEPIPVGESARDQPGSDLDEIVSVE